MTMKRILLWIVSLLLMASAVTAMVVVTTCEVKSVEIRGNTRYSDEEVKEMVLTGPLSRYSLLAPALCTKENVRNVYYVDGWTVTRTAKDSLVITLKEKTPVGCISYLDNYVYFDKNGCFVDASPVHDERIPYFDGIKVTQVIENEKLPIRGSAVLDTAVCLAAEFQKEDRFPDHAEFDARGGVSLSYDDITVSLGQNEYMEDKMARALAILPQLEGMKGVLHLEGISEKTKNVTFEPSSDSPALPGEMLGSYFSDEDETSPASGDEGEDYYEEDSDETDPEDGSTEEEQYGETSESYNASSDGQNDEDQGDAAYDGQEENEDQNGYDDLIEDYDEYDEYDSYEEYEGYSDSGGIYDEAYYDQLYEGIYW